MNLERVIKERNCNIELMRCLMMLLIVRRLIISRGDRAIHVLNERN